MERAVRLLLQQEDLAFDAEIEAEPHGLGLGHDGLQGDTGRERIRLALERQVRRTPGELRFPGQLDQLGEVRHGGQFVLVRSLAEPVEGITGIALGPRRHLRKVVDGHDLGLLRAMDVDISADDVFHALGAQLVLQLGDGGIDFGGMPHWAAPWF